MKAIILAGGRGTRLRPLTCDLPKPMVRLFDRPVMEHIWDLLRKHGFDQICASLGYLSQTISDCFGARIRCFTDPEPLGTAGSVRNCADFVAGEDVLIISGDAVCDFPLGDIWNWHKSRGGAATLVAFRHPEPLSYGLVQRGPDDRLVRLSEKPDWGGVFTDLVNTGIYILSPRALERIPEGRPYDFAADLFPAMLAAGEDIFVYEARGSWWDIGDSGELLRCGKQALRGRLELNLPAPLLKPGVWSASPVREDVTVIPPCYIGRRVLLGAGAVIGPEAIIGADSIIESGARVDGSMVMGARIGENAVLRDAIVLEGAQVQDEAQMHPGSVAGRDSLIRTAARISEGVRLWPGTRVPGRATQRRSLFGGCSETELLDGRGRISGDPRRELTPPVLMDLGAALAPLGQVTLACDGSADAELALDSIGCGLRSAGGSGVTCDAAFLSQAAFAARTYGAPLSVFTESRGGGLLISLMGSRGTPLTPGQRTHLRSSIRQGTVPSDRPIGTLSAVSGIPRLHLAAAGEYALPPRAELEVCVVGDSRAAAFGRRLLTSCGARVVEPARGVVRFFIDAEGALLSLTDEEGVTASQPRIWYLLARCLLESGVRDLVLPPEAPRSVQDLAAHYNARIRREGEPPLLLRDGALAAAYLCRIMVRDRKTMSVLLGSTPTLTAITVSVPLQHGRARAMDRLAARTDGQEQSPRGVTCRGERGLVHIRPCATADALRICAEAAGMEAAQELCDQFRRRIRSIDR